MELELLQLIESGVDKIHECLRSKYDTSDGKIIFRQDFDARFKCVELLKNHETPFSIKFLSEPCSINERDAKQWGAKHSINSLDIFEVIE